MSLTMNPYASFTLEPEEFIPVNNDKPDITPHFATFDLESENWIDALCCGFYDGYKYKDFWGNDCIKEMLEYIFKIKYSGKIFSHFGGRFDSLFIMEEAYRKKLLKQSKIILASGSLMKLSIEYIEKRQGKPYKKSVNFVDSYDLLRASLKELCKEFNVKHKKGDLDRTNMGQYSKAEITPYLKNDVIGLHEIMTIYYNKILDCTKQFPYLTIGSTAINSFMNTCQHKFETLNNDEIDIFIRKTYKGGRVEVFKTYGKTLYYYDFNSLYPSQMINKPMPVSKYLKINKYKNIEPYFNEFCGFGKFKIKETPDLHIPFLSYGYNGKLTFPRGSFTDYYAFSEIEKALELGYEIEFLGGYVSKAVNNLFDDWILPLYKNKLEYKAKNDDAMVLIIKLILNNAYGKFGEKKVREALLTTLTKEDILSGEVTEYMHEPELYLRDKTFDRKYHNVGIASQITAYSRQKLFEEIQKIISMGYNIYYVDTDSIITDCPPHKLKTSSTELGILKIEDLMHEGIFIAPKLYGYLRNQAYARKVLRMKEEKNKKFKKVHKGFPELDCTFQELKDKYFNNELRTLEYKATSICKFRESLKRKSFLKRNGPFLTSKNVSKKLKSVYDKRVVLEDMIHTEPLTFYEGILV